MYSILEFLKKLVQQSLQQTVEATDASGSTEGPSLGKNPGTRLELHGCGAGKRKKRSCMVAPMGTQQQCPFPGRGEDLGSASFQCD